MAPPSFLHPSPPSGLSCTSRGSFFSEAPATGSLLLTVSSSAILVAQGRGRCQMEPTTDPPLSPGGGVQSALPDPLNTKSGFGCREKQAEMSKTPPRRAPLAPKHLGGFRSRPAPYLKPQLIFVFDNFTFPSPSHLPNSGREEITHWRGSVAPLRASAQLPRGPQGREVRPAW